ncbi:MAG: SDR family NAD(P)-dependent oxidoreductase [Chitinophagaceae bacterium]|nr:MAG: SDR family NAD(P)-dependent oxidoreductase [Chitinophagaceae bacterium]
MRNSINDKVIYITGGSKGIGFGIARVLLASGAKVAISSRSLEAAQSAAAELGPNVLGIQSDVASLEAEKNAIQKVVEHFGKLDVLVANAGVGHFAPIDVISEKEWHDTINTNLTGTIQMVHRFLPHLLRQRSAAIINVSSGIAFMPYSSAPVYSASKAGVRAYTQALRLQLEDTNVKVMEMIPPGVNTNLQNDWAVKPNPSQMMDVDKMVSVVIKGLQNDKKELKPVLISVLAFLSRLIPGALLKFGHREFKKFTGTAKHALR